MAATTDLDPVEIAKDRLTTVGAWLMSPADLNMCLGVVDDEWARFASHWDELAPDSYAAELGTRRLRRYGSAVQPRSAS